MTDTEFNTKVDERIDMKLSVALEHIDHQFEKFVETMDAIIERRVRPIVQEELIEIKEDMATVKIAVKETNQDVRDLKQRVTKIEQSHQDGVGAY